MNLDFDFRPLGGAIVAQAVRDARSDDPIRALDAALWLVGDGPIWMDGLGLYADPVAFLTGGKVRRVRKDLLYERHKHSRHVGRSDAGRGKEV